MERAADAEDCRARLLTLAESQSNPAALVAASARAAKPEALDASPEPVGKSFAVSTQARVRTSATDRTRSSIAVTRFASASLAALPLMTTRSRSRPGPNPTLVVVDMASSVIERLGTAGRFSAASIFPQYFARAMLG